MAKERDGHLSAEQIGDLGAALEMRGDVAVSLVAWPEVSGGSQVLHCVQVRLASGEQFIGQELALAASGVGLSKERQQPMVGKDSRHQLFVAWLIQTFGLDRLRNGAGVLDVAGGGSGGGVAFELAFRRGVPTTIVDPRPLQLTSKQRRAFSSRIGPTGRRVGTQAEGNVSAASVAVRSVRSALHALPRWLQLPVQGAVPVPAGQQEGS